MGVFSVDNVQGSESTVLQAVEQTQVDVVQAFYKALQISKLEIEKAMHCPIGLSYFSRYLMLELGTDTLINAFVDLKSLNDYLENLIGALGSSNSGNINANVNASATTVGTISGALVEKCDDFIASYCSDTASTCADISTLGVDSLSLSTCVATLKQARGIFSAVSTAPSTSSSVVQLEQECKNVQQTVCKTIQVEIFNALRDSFEHFQKSDLFRELCALILNYDYAAAKDSVSGCQA